MWWAELFLGRGWWPPYYHISDITAYNVVVKPLNNSMFMLKRDNFMRYRVLIYPTSGVIYIHMQCINVPF
jgi:hypothetical protein